MWKFLFDAATIILAIALVLSVITLQLQCALGCGLAIVALGLLTVPADRANQRSQTTESVSRTEQKQQSRALKVFRPEVQSERNPPALFIVRSASREYGVPAEILLSHWYLESGMSLGGGTGVGRHLALAQIARKQETSSNVYRRQRFVANEADLRAIAEHCGYDLQEIKGSSTGALGPMQFQPSTWVLGAVDADGDGKACPLNLADAVFTAARKLSRDYERLGSWNQTMLQYAGGDCAENRAYVRRAQPLLRYFQKFWQERETPVASNP